MDIITQNEDRVITITVKDELGAVIDPSTIQSLLITIHQLPASVIATFLKADMKNINAILGTFNVLLTRDKSQNLIKGNVFITMSADFTDADFPNRKRSVTAGKILAEVIENIDKTAP